MNCDTVNASVAGPGFRPVASRTGLRANHLDESVGDRRVDGIVCLSRDHTRGQRQPAVIEHLQGMLEDVFSLQQVTRSS